MRIRMKNFRNITAAILASIVLFGPWTLSWGSGGMFERPGVIGMRALVKDSDGNPEFVEYDQNGNVVGSIGYKRGELAEARVMSANKYRAIVLQYEGFKIDNPEKTRGSQVFLRDEYVGNDFGTVSVWDGDTQSYVDMPVPTLAEGQLHDSTVSVLVRSNETIPDPRFLPEDRANVLFEAPINLKKGVLQTDLKESVRSLLVGPQGKVLETSQHNIGFRTAYVEPREDGEEPTLLGMAPGDKLLGPVVGARVFTSLDPTERWAGFSDDEGRFSARYYIVPCPGFSFTYDFTINAAVKYKSFNPQSSSPTAETYFRTFGTHTCIGYSEIAHPLAPGLQATLAAIEASMAVPIYMAHIPVDAVLFTGEGRLVNPVSDGGFEEIPIDSETRYRSDVAPVTESTAPSHLDLDADRKEDWVSAPDEDGMVDVILGEEPAGFNDEGQPVDEDGNVIEPDLRRVADHEPDFESRGLLESISPEDLEDTDLYIYRESTGELVAEKHGLKEREVQQEEGRFVYRMFLPGPAAGFSIRSNFHNSLEAWQSEAGLSESLRGRETDSLRPGESVKIIAINRPTGYIGTVNTTIEPSTEGGRLDFPIDKLQLAPPNLKVKAERVYIVPAGLTGGEQRKHTIGFEGAGLTEDKYISIRTEWYDHDGRPLPNDLDGYTGRLAQVVGENTLAPTTTGQSDGESSGGAGFFRILPGTHRQVIKLKHDVLSTEHFYVHVSGQPRSELADFSETGAGDGLLQYRPRHYTPVRVPIFDESATRRLRNQAFYREDDGADIDDADIQALYRWPYRPEMQFSVLDLETEKFAFQFEDAAGEAHNINLSDLSQNDFNDLLSEVTALDLLYALTQSEDSPLELFNTPGQLVFAFGEDEVAATVTEEGLIEFSNLDHLSELSLEDFLTIRLFRNNDAENVLWEWAFLPNIYFVDETGQKVTRDRSFSHPNPVIEIGKGPDLAPIEASDINVDPSTGSASVDITGRIFSDIADVADDPSAHISDVFIYVTTQPTEGGIKKIQVPVTNTSEYTVEDYLPFDPDATVDSLDDERHPFVGTFSTTVDFAVSEGDVTIMAEAINVIGNDGHDAIELKLDHGEEGSHLAAVENHEQGDRGLFQPLWMQVEDPLLEEQELAQGSIRLLGRERDLIKHDGKIYAEGALIRVARPLGEVESTNIANVLTEQEPVIATYESPAEKLDTPPSEAEMTWSYTAASPANYYKYASGTTVGHKWYSWLLQTGWELTDVKVTEKTGWFWSWSEQDEQDVSVKPIPITQDGVQTGVKFLLDIGNEAIHNPEKRLHITLKKGDEELAAVANTGYFKVVPLKTIIMAIDGFAYESAREVVQDAPNFNRVFGNGHGVGLDEAALSALPSITWANWASVFSGQPPGEHGILGNSYFPREKTLNMILETGSERFKSAGFPVFSSGRTGKMDLDKVQHLGVASGGQKGPVWLAENAFSMAERAKDTAGSIYDNIADAAGAAANDPFHVRSIRAFYAGNNEPGAPVTMDKTFFGEADFGLGQGSIELQVDPWGHGEPWAGILDNGLDSLVDFGIVSGNDIVDRTVGTGPQAVMAWRNKRDRWDLMTLYLPGTDNLAHDEGDTAGDAKISDAVDPVSSIVKHASEHTDAALGQLLEEIESDGYANAVMFAATGDHGLKQYTQNDELVIDVPEVQQLVEAPPSEGGLGWTMWRGESTTGEDGDDYDELASYLNQHSRLVYAPNGGLAQIYVRSEGQLWFQAPNADDVKQVASLLWRESMGHECPSWADVSKDSEGECYESGPFKKFVQIQPRVDGPERPKTTDGAFGRPPAIFVKLDNSAQEFSFENDYAWVKAVESNHSGGNDPSNYTGLILGTVNEFLDERSKTGESLNHYWVAFEERLKEMNDTNPDGSRSGDIVVFFHSKYGYLTVNEANDEGISYPGWHGGPTWAESAVPLMLGMPGGSFVDCNGGSLKVPGELAEALTTARKAHTDEDDENSYLRNWHLYELIGNSLSEFSDAEGHSCQF